MGPCGLTCREARPLGAATANAAPDGASEPAPGPEPKADEAKEVGLVNEVFAKDVADEAVDQIAHTMADNAPRCSGRRKMYDCPKPRSR